MPFARDPTYLLAPNWTFRPDGPIALGNIIVDPFRPQDSIFKPTRPLPATETAKENNWTFETERVRSINVNIWTRLFGQLGLKFGPSQQKTNTVKIIMKSLETVYFRDVPSMPDIQELANEPIVRSILNADRLFRTPVYMVTGLKIAKGFQLTHRGSSEYGFTAKASETVTPEVSAGGTVNIEESKSAMGGFEAANDIIFAYQLLIIKPKGWGQNTTFKLDEYRNKAAMLVGSDGDKEEEEEVEVEFGSATIEDLIKVQEGFTNVPGDNQLAWLIQDE